MLDEKRIKEAESNVKSYLDEGLLKKSEFNSRIYDILRKNAQESLNVANFLYKNKKSYLWIIATSYYSMFYLANSLLYKLGYKVGEKIAHKITADSLIDGYEDIRDEALATMKSDELIEHLDLASELDRDQYNSC